jgi:hypothetical protein
MNLFANNTEMLTFVLLAIPFVGVLVTTIVMLYSDRYAQDHANLANRIFNGKSTKIGRMVVIAALAAVTNAYHWLMVETLLIAILVWHIGFALMLRNKADPNLSLKKH